MDKLIETLAASQNLAVIVLVIANGGLLWLVRYLLQVARENSKEQSAADQKLAEALVLLRATVESTLTRCGR